jgi:GTPase SAR1 family protein
MSYKISLLGLTNSGKTHIIHQLKNNKEEYIPSITIGINFCKIIFNDKELDILDYSGSPKFLSFINIDKTLSDYVFIVCNINDINSICIVNDYRLRVKNVATHILINIETFDIDLNDNRSKLNKIFDNLFGNNYSYINSYSHKNIHDTFNLLLS